MVYDYESQPVAIFEGSIERGRRINGVTHVFERRDGKLAGTRTSMVNMVPQAEIPVAFLDMPRPYLLAVDDWNRQTSGENLLASMGVTWAPGSQSASVTSSSSSASQEGGRPGTAGARTAQGRNGVTRHGDSAACQCLALRADDTREVLRNTCKEEVYHYFCVQGYDCESGSVSSSPLTERLNNVERGINNAVKGTRRPWGYGAAYLPEVTARKGFNFSWADVKANGWVCSDNRVPVTFPSDAGPPRGAK